MSEPGATAGALLRAAREKQGLHIAALAAAIKVTPRKLEALENDRYDELPDAAFTRALAQTICRQLKVDAQPVLALLPHTDPSALDHVTGTLNTPFRERSSRNDPVGLAAAAVRPMVGAGLLLLVAAAVVYLLPADFWQRQPALPDTVATTAAPAPEPAASAVPPEAVAASAPEAPVPAAVSASVPVPVVVGAAAAAVAPATSSVPAASAAEPARLVQLRAEDSSWVEARDARGQVLLSRTLQRGESVGLDGALPIRLTIGNASGTRVAFRGEAIDLALKTRDNVARLELQ